MTSDDRFKCILATIWFAATLVFLAFLCRQPGCVLSHYP